MASAGDPVLHLIAGPNGAGKTTFVERVLRPVTGLVFINADVIAARQWPGEEMEHAYEAAALAARDRDRHIAERRSFIAETVFSHHSKVELAVSAEAAGYRTTLHVVVIPVDLAVARVSERVRRGGHAVPEEKIRSRHDRLWHHVAEAIETVDETFVYDNSRLAEPFRLVASYLGGRLVEDPVWPSWSPEALCQAGR